MRYEYSLTQDVEEGNILRVVDAPYLVLDRRYEEADDVYILGLFNLITQEEDDLYATRDFSWPVLVYEDGTQSKVGMA